MQINRSTAKLLSLSLLLFLLASKTSQATTYTAEWYIISLPSFVILIGNYITLLAASALLFHLTINISSPTNRLRLGKATTLISAILSYYHLRSFQVGSGDLANIVAIAITILIALSFSLNNDENTDIALRALMYAFGGFIFLSFALYITGYGYPISGGRRFFGLTPHPNFQGIYSALAFAFFVSASSWNIFNVRKITLAVLWATVLLSLLLIIISGSRTAIALAAITVVTTPKLHHKILFGALLITAVTAMGSVALIFPDSAISMALARAQDAPIDNRFEVWRALIADFHDYPILGAGDRSGVSGSGFLTAFSGTGILLGSIFTLCLGFIAANNIKRILKNRTQRHSDGKFVFSILLMQIIAGSLFEGYMFDKFGLISALTILTLAQLESRKIQSKATNT